jgi:hypothetical protein
MIWTGAPLQPQPNKPMSRQLVLPRATDKDVED